MIKTNTEETTDDVKVITDICLWTADCGYLNKALSESSCNPANHKTTETAAYLTFTTVLLALVQTRHNETIYQRIQLKISISEDS